MEGLSHYHKEDRPWGSFERFTLNEPSTVKIITIKPGEAFSLQQHTHRDEEWKFLNGTGTVTVGDINKEVGPGDTFFVLRGTTHRVEGGKEGLQFLEIALGDFDESDIVRFEDKYGRA